MADDRLNAIRSVVYSLSESAEEDADVTHDLLGSVNNHIADLGSGIGSLEDTTRDGFSMVSGGIEALTGVTAGGFSMVAAELAALIGVTAIGFMGLGAMLAYREQNDRIRHAELMAHNLENSDAARARRALQLALTYCDSGNHSGAIKQVRAAINHFPTWAEVHRVEALIRGRSGDMPGAIAALDSALMLLNRDDPQPSQFVSDSDDLLSLRRAVVLQRAATLVACERLAEAADCLQVELDEWQENSELWHEQGRILALSGKDDEARTALMLAVWSNPKRYGVVAVDPQLAGFRGLVDSALKEVRTISLDQMMRLECVWMSLHGRRGMKDLPEIESNATVTYGNICARVDSLKHMLSPDEG
jgi:tetratricopeptide (TPR) repeat protein